MKAKNIDRMLGETCQLLQILADDDRLIVFDAKRKSLFEVKTVCINGGGLQLNINEVTE